LADKFPSSRLARIFGLDSGESWAAASLIEIQLSKSNSGLPTMESSKIGIAEGY